MGESLSISEKHFREYRAGATKREGCVRRLNPAQEGGNAYGQEGGLPPNEDRQETGTEAGNSQGS